MTLSKAAYQRLSHLKALIRRTPIGRMPWARRAYEVLRGRLGSSSDDGIRLRFGDIVLWFPSSFKPHYVERDYEPITRAWIEREVKPGMRVIDVGAHVGFFTLTMGSLVGPQGRVFAFEPAEENLQYLRENIARNGMKHVEVFPYAVGPTSEMRRFHITGSSDSHGFYAHPLTETLRTVDVRQVALDDVISQRIDLIKIDVEGAELEALSGMSVLLERCAGLCVIIEWNPACMGHAGYEPLSLPKKLQSLGFDLVVLDDRGGKERGLESTLRAVGEGRVDPSWYVNLAGRRRSSR